MLIAPQRYREQPNLRIKAFFNLAKVLLLRMAFLVNRAVLRQQLLTLICNQRYKKLNTDVLPCSF
ncbi:hypothetical protein [Nodularia sp. NIES-3585]|uniref:hypothetical protein n=1 Tax=Nodularia sp. NIES-3585 TaxID=1973477 RepID=UPI001130204B|nr:hypothetical protein [Nodularia sp. NIES-3585]